MNSNTNQKYAQISWYKLLTALGSDVTDIDINALQPCPMHANLAPSLKVKYTDEGILVFECNYPHCKFKGDHIQLTAQRMNILSDDAVKLFKPNNQLAATILDSDTTNYLIEYTNSEINQDIIKHFMSDCHAQLISSDNPHCALITNFLAGKNWIPPSEHNIPRNVGYLDYSLIPSQLDVLKKTTYKKEPHLLFGLQYGDTWTGFSVYNINNRDTTTYKFLASPNYIFDLTEGSNTDTLYIAPNELYALAINLKSKMYANKPLGAVSMSGGVLPKSYSQFNKVKIIDTNNHPLTVSKSLDIFKNESIIEDSLEIKNIVVTAMKKEITKVSLANFLASGNAARGLGIAKWIAKELIDISTSDVTTNVFETLYTHKLPTVQFDKLTAALLSQGATPAFVDELKDYNFKVHNDIFLNNRYLIRKSKYGIHGISGSGNKALISNVVIDIHRKFMTNQETTHFSRCSNVLCDCSLTVDGFKVDTMIPYDAFVTRLTLKNQLNNAFMEHGLAPKIFISENPRKLGTWDEIRDALTESHIVEREIATLGFTDGNTFDLPMCRVGKEITPQKHIYTIDQAVIDMYKGININESDTTVTAIKTLLQRDDPTSLILSTFISQFVHSAVQGLQLLSGANFAPHHLVLAYNDNDNIEEIFKQLVLLTSNTLCQDRLPHKQPLKFLSDIKEIGTLPFITRLPDYALLHRVSLLRESPVNLISTVPMEDCGRLTDIKNISFIIAEPDSIYDNKSIIAIQQALPCLMQQILQSDVIKVDKFLGETITPAAGTYRKICKLLDVEPKAIEKVLKPYHVPTYLALDKMFIHDVQTMLKENSIRLVYVDERTSDMPSTVIQISNHHQEVYILNSIVSAVNQIMVRNYRGSAVKYHLEAAKIISKADKNYWTIPLDIWESKFATAVAPEVLNFPKPKLLALSS